MAYSNEDQAFLEAQSIELEAARLDNIGKDNKIAQQMLSQQEENSSMIREQLDLSQEIITLKHILQGHILSEEEETGRVYWQESNDPSLVLLTDYGVNYLIQFITAYSTKNTLLSNYDEDTINKKMEDIATTLIDRIFMNYEKFFKPATLEECKNIFKSRIQAKAESRMYSYELQGIKGTIESITKELLDERKDTIEKELEKIKEQSMKDKLKSFDSLSRLIQDFIHSSYNRAYAGQERKTLRQHIHISESSNPRQPIKQPSKLSLLNR
jgi:hypothetical protein